MSASERLSVTICACTYRRPSGLAALLEGLGRQTFERVPRPILRVVIVDNEGSDRAKELCGQFGLSSDIPIEYVHEARRGISHARNACLDLLRDDCDFFAMIDDDEIPHPDWIEQLLLAQQRTGAHVVQGRVIPAFPGGVPEWIVQGHYFGWPRDLDRPRDAQFQPYAELKKAMTNNVLVRHSVVVETGLRFDPQFGLTGGSDIVFFRALRAAGYRIVYAPDACVKDVIPRERARLRYLWWRWYRSGSNARFKRPNRRKPSAKLKRRLMEAWNTGGGAEVAGGLAMLTGMIVRGTIDMRHLAPGIRRIAYGLGQAASAIGFRYEQYRHEHADGDSLGHPRRLVDR